MKQADGWLDYQHDNNTSLDEPLTVLAALEALVSLIIEVTFIATLTQRFFNR